MKLKKSLSRFDSSVFKLFTALIQSINVTTALPEYLIMRNTALKSGCSFTGETRTEVKPFYFDKLLQMQSKLGKLVVI